MSEYEFFNQKVDERKAAVIKTQRKTSLLLLIRIFVPVAIALVLLAVLAMVGFISNVFCMILSVIAVVYGSFMVGRVWYKIKW